MPPSRARPRIAAQNAARKRLPDISDGRQLAQFEATRVTARRVGHLDTQVWDVQPDAPSTGPLSPDDDARDPDAPFRRVTRVPRASLVLRFLSTREHDVALSCQLSDAYSLLHFVPRQVDHLRIIRASHTVEFIANVFVAGDRRHHQVVTATFEDNRAASSFFSFFKDTARALARQAPLPGGGSSSAACCVSRAQCTPALLLTYLMLIVNLLSLCVIAALDLLIAVPTIEPYFASPPSGATDMQLSLLRVCYYTLRLVWPLGLLSWLVGFVVFKHFRRQNTYYVFGFVYSLLRGLLVVPLSWLTSACVIVLDSSDVQALPTPWNVVMIAMCMAHAFTSEWSKAIGVTHSFMPNLRWRYRGQKLFLYMMLLVTLLFHIQECVLLGMVVKLTSNANLLLLAVLDSLLYSAFLGLSFLHSMDASRSSWFSRLSNTFPQLCVLYKLPIMFAHLFDIGPHELFGANTIVYVTRTLGIAIVLFQLQYTAEGHALRPLRYMMREEISTVLLDVLDGLSLFSVPYTISSYLTNVRQDRPPLDIAINTLSTFALLLATLFSYFVKAETQTTPALDRVTPLEIVEIVRIKRFYKQRGYRAIMFGRIVLDVCVLAVRMYLWIELHAVVSVLMLKNALSLVFTVRRLSSIFGMPRGNLVPHEFSSSSSPTARRKYASLRGDRASTTPLTSSSSYAGDAGSAASSPRSSLFDPTRRMPTVARHRNLAQYLRRRFSLRPSTSASSLAEALLEHESGDGTASSLSEAAAAAAAAPRAQPLAEMRDTTVDVRDDGGDGGDADGGRR